MTKFKVTYEIDHIDENYNWKSLYRKDLGTHKADTIEEIINLFSSIYKGDIDFNPSYRSFATIFLHEQTLPNDNEIEIVINIEELKI